MATNAKPDVEVPLDQTPSDQLVLEDIGVGSGRKRSRADS